MRKILVLGNGFDLHHGLATRYSDFVSFTLKFDTENEVPEEIQNICINNVFIKHFKKVYNATQNWIDCEKEIENVVITIQKIVNGCKSSQTGNVSKSNLSWTSQDELTFTSIMPKYALLHQGRDITIENKYKKNNVFNKMKFFDDIRKELDDLIKALAYYLEQQEKDMKISRYKQMQEITPDIVINFNYTRTYSKLYSDTTEVFYQHGSLLDCTSMVLGIPDSKAVTLDFVYFKKFFQRMQKRLGSINNLPLIKELEIETESPEVYFVGLSMGTTDADIITNIISKTAKSVIFYYDQNDYETKLINLIDIYGRDKLEDMLEKNYIEFVELNIDTI